MKYLVSLRCLIVSFVLLFNLVTTALASPRTETYQIYQTFSKQECRQRTQSRQCGESQITESFCEYYTAYGQVSVTATRCQSGWGPEPNCDDLDECRYRVHGCAHTCTNTFESYICSCNVGYRLASDGRACNDIDECQERTSRCSQICYNTVGSYSCNCNTRYSLASDGRTCNDIDECTARTPGCNHSCSNTIGSYKCNCGAGYRLASDGRSCDDLDECKAKLDNCTELENFICENTVGGYQCVCKAGFEQVGLQECRDIDECNTLTSNCTLDEGMICENIIGGYKCHRDSNRTGLAVGVTVGVVVGIIFIIMVVYFVGRARQRKKQAQESTKRRSSPEIQYEEVVPSKMKPNKQEQCSSTPESIEKQASPEFQYEEVDVPAKNKPNKQELSSGTTTLCPTPAVHEDLQNETAEPYSEYQDLGTVEKPKPELYEVIRKPSKSSDTPVQEEVNKDSEEKEV